MRKVAKMFRMKKLPKKPTRRKEEIYFVSDYKTRNISMLDIIRYFENFGQSAENVYLVYDDSYNGDRYDNVSGRDNYTNFDSVIICSEIDEPEDKYQARLKEWDIKVQEYNQWKTDNADEIKIFKAKEKEKAAKRKAREFVKKEKERIKEFARLMRVKEATEKKLAKMEAASKPNLEE